MRVKYVNEAIMAVLLDGHHTVKYCKLPDGRYLFSDEGIVAYVLDEKEIYFSLDKCLHNPFDFLQNEAPALNLDTLLTPTMDVRVGKGGALLTRLKSTGWDTFVDMDLLDKAAKAAKGCMAWATENHPEWCHILRTTKKKRTRKKYAQRIMREYVAALHAAADITAGIMTPNEARRLMGLPPV